MPSPGDMLYYKVSTELLKFGVPVTRSDKYEIDLFYSVRNQSEAAFSDELSRIASQKKNFRFHKYFSDDAGHISADAIMSKIGASPEAEIFLCGPAGFMKNLRKQFREAGFDDKKIHSEEFNLYF